MKKNVFFGFLVMLLVTGCAVTQKQLNRSEIYDQFEAVAELNQNLEAAEKDEIDTFAPEGFLKAKKLFAESFEMARTGTGDEPTHVARKGLSVLTKAKSDAEHARKVMWEVIENRERAQKAGAPELFKKEYEDAENNLRKATRLIEAGNTAKGKDLRPSLIDSYSELEIEALKKGILDLAKASFKQAKLKDADDYAPKTFQLAEKELNLAISILKADRTRTQKANAHAKLADKTAKKAGQITELVKLFKRRKYSFEDIILWYQDQLSEINKPLGSELDFKKPNHIIIGSLHDTIKSLVQSLDDSRKITAKQQERIDELKKKYESKLSTQEAKGAEKERLLREAAQRFKYVESLFSAKEAQVFRKGNNVLIAAHGFYFPVGEAEILAINFGLLNKFINAIQQFPDAQIKVSGHTDATGSAEINLPLSQKRADKVADFLINVGNINQSRIAVKGYGETKPVASNETEAGRAKNRRIELLIINK